MYLFATPIMLIASPKAVRKLNRTEPSINQILQQNCTALMEENGKEVIVQCESDKSVSRKYQNKALALSIYVFISFYFWLMEMVGKIFLEWKGNF